MLIKRFIINLKGRLFISVKLTIINSSLCQGWPRSIRNTFKGNTYNFVGTDTHCLDRLELPKKVGTKKIQKKKHPNGCFYKLIKNFVIPWFFYFITIAITITVPITIASCHISIIQHNCHLW